MFCDKCGNNNPNDAKFCEACGNPITSPQAPTAPTAPMGGTYYPPAPAKPSGSNPAGKIIAIIIAIAVIAAAVFGVVKLVGCVTGGGVEAPVKNFVKFINNGDTDALLKAFPESYTKDMEDYLKDVDAMMLRMMEQEYGDDYKVSYKITDKKKIDKDDLKDIEDEENEMLESLDIDKIEIKDGYELEVELKVKGSEDEDEDELEISVYKVDGRWCFIRTDMPTVGM